MQRHSPHSTHQATQNIAALASTRGSTLIWKLLRTSDDCDDTSEAQQRSVELGPTVPQNSTTTNELSVTAELGLRERIAQLAGER